MSAIIIVPTGEQYVDGFWRAVDAVARERRYLAFVEGPPIDMSRGWVRALVAGAGVQMLALDDDAVVGWCDIVRNSRPGFEHCGTLGMGVLRGARGRGLGERLARATIDAARRVGIERVELEVFSTNDRALRLYERLGFVVEGVKRDARRLDGRSDDNVLMALRQPLR